MKTRLLTVLAFLFLINTARASHFFGGEITWTCISSGPNAGKFQFQLKMYIECVGTGNPFYTSINVYGHPTLCTIPFNVAANVLNDISPSQCINNCNTGGAGTANEIIQTSFPIAIAGVPPASGWVFEVNGCCRSSHDNLGGGGQSFSIRSVMYPYNGINTNPCFDSSPYFAERPVLFSCVGYPFSYNPNGIDPDKDSLVYEWANCVQTPTNAPCGFYNGAVIPFSVPYSTQIQLPGSPVLHPKTGQLNFFIPDSAATIGNFVMCYKVTAYKCGIKVAEVFRDCAIKLTNGCLVQGVPPNNINVPPVVTPPFNGAWADTIVAGDTLCFNLLATDYQANIGGAFQSVTINASGEYFGTGFTSISTGCPFPPCATLTPPPPISTPIATQTQFCWAPGCSNLINCNSDKYNTHHFVFKVGDTFCPTPAYMFATVSITVVAPSIQYSQDSMWVSYPSATSFQWYSGGVLIPGATDSLYVTNVPGFYTCQIGTATGCSFPSQPYWFVNTTSVDVIYSFNVVPNPAKQNFSIQINAAAFQNSQLNFTDVMGRIIFSESIQLKAGKNTFDFDAAKFARGFYNVQLTTGKNMLIKKLIVQ